MTTLCIVQARMGSTRLPGKSAMDICGKPMIWHVLNRVKQARLIDQVVLAIPNEPDNAIVWLSALSAGVVVAQIDGDRSDLVDRYARVAKVFCPEVVVRVPGDNPCVDPDQIDRIIELYHSRQPPVHFLTSNLDRDILENGYPGGLGAEVYDARFIQWMDGNVKDPYLREHPHMWAFRNNRVITCQCPREIRRPELRFDVNVQTDLAYIREIYEALYPTNANFRTTDILTYLDQRSKSGEVTLGKCTDR